MSGDWKLTTRSLISSICKLPGYFMDLLQSITSHVGALFVIGMTLLMMETVIARYYFDTSWGLAHVVLKGMLVWGLFLIIGSVARRHEHVGIGFFIGALLRDKAKSFQATVENIIGLPFCIYLAWHSWKWVDTERDWGAIEYVGTITYPVWIPIVIVPIGFSIAALFYLERCVRQLHSLPFWRKDRQIGMTSDDHQGN